MLTVMPETQGNLLGLQATGRLTDQDYKEVLIPRIEQIVAESGKARLVFYMDENFEGWDLHALWDDAKWGIAHKNDFEAIAVVGGPKWVQWGVRLDAHFIPGAVKTFPVDQLTQAWEWARTVAMEPCA